MFDVIYVDPPWSFNVWSKDTGNGRSAISHYQTMPKEELRSLPVGKIAAKDCALFMWVTYPVLIEAIELGQAWGFEYKTCAFDWVKRSSQNNAWHTGMGYWTRANSEPCLLFTKGSPKRVDKGVPQVLIDDSLLPILDTLITPIRRHSEKPLEAYERIERLMGDVARVEIFARQRREGWASLGNEIDGKDIRDAIYQLIEASA